MDVVNGKIVDRELVAGTETIRSWGSAMTTGTNGDERRVMADQQRAWSGVRASRGLGLVADARADTGYPQQVSTGGLVEWAPTWVASGVYVGDNLSPAAAVPAGSASAAPWGILRAPERGGRGARDFTGMQEMQRPGWKRAADQGIVDFASSQALGLKPSRARAVGSGSGLCARDQLPGSFARAAAADWAPTWAPSVMSLEPMAGSRLGVNAAARSGAVQPDHRHGWKRSISSGTGLSGPRCGSVDQQHQHHFDASPCSESKLDEEMTQFELQLTRSVSSHISNRTGISQPSAPVVIAAGAAAALSAEKKVVELVPATTATLKRKRSGLVDGDIQGEWGWTLPLKLLVRKELTVSDVGELGRIIVPKKDAESQYFPQIDNKEGRVMEMEDYSASKRWYFRFKYWTNNKSRMYVLENTARRIETAWAN